MEQPIPTIGRIVIYMLKTSDAEAINRRRDHAKAHMDEHRANATGVMVHVGNMAKTGEEYPMIITRTWGPDLVNGTVMLDGSDTFWATSVGHGDQPGMWHWPTRT